MSPPATELREGIPRVTAADRAEDIAFGPRLLDEATSLDLLDRLRRVVLSLTYYGPLFTDPATVAKKLAEQGVNGASIISRLRVMRGAEQTEYSNEVAEMALAHAVANRVEAAYRH